MSSIEGFLQQAPNKRYHIHRYDQEAASEPERELTSGDAVEMCRPNESYIRGHVEHHVKNYGGYYFSPCEMNIAPFALQEGFEARIVPKSVDRPF